MPDTRISFTIAASDQTKAAFDSVKSGLRSVKTDTDAFNSGLKSLTSSVLSGMGVFASFSSVIYGLNQAFQKGFKAVETYNQSVASLAAMVVTFSKKESGQTLETQWKAALQYSSAMVPVLENLAAKTLLSGEETTALANAFARAGVFLDANNSKQVEAFTRISNAIPLMTQGQAIMLQINQEIRGLMNGGNVANSMLLQTLKAIDPEIEKHLKTWREEQSVMENIGELLAGFGPATALLENQWQAVKSTIDTTATQILRGAMKPAYEEIIKLTKTLNDYLVENKTAILNWTAVVEQRFRTMFKIISTTYNILKFIDKFSFSSPYKSQNNNIKGLWEYGAEKQTVPSPPEGIATIGEKAGKSAKKAADEYDRLVKKADEFIKKAKDGAEMEGMGEFRKTLYENQVAAEKEIESLGRLTGAKREEAVAAIEQIRLQKDNLAAIKETERQRDAAVKSAKEQAKSEADAAQAVKEAEERLLTIRENVINQRKFSLDLAALEGASYREQLAERIDLEKQVLAVQQDRLSKADPNMDLSGYISQQRAIQETQRAILELQNKNQEVIGSFSEGWEKAAKAYQENAITAFTAGRDIFNSSVQSMTDFLSSGFFDVVRGKFDSLQDYFKNFANSILKIFTDMLARMVVEAAMAQMESGIGSLFGLFGGLFGGGSAAAGAGAAVSLDELALPFLVAHGGGVVGEPGMAYRVMPSSAYFGAPRFHSGLAADEYAAVLRKGESVFTPGQTRALGGLASRNDTSGGEQHVHINIVAADARSFSDMIKRNPASVIQPITDALKANSINKQWKELLR